MANAAEWHKDHIQSSDAAAESPLVYPPPVHPNLNHGGDRLPFIPENMRNEPVLAPTDEQREYLRRLDCWNRTDPRRRRDKNRPEEPALAMKW